MSLTTVDQGLLGTYAQYTGFKNRLINGSMSVWQRGTAAADVTSNGVGYTTADRFFVYQNGTVSVQASQTTGTAGFPYALKWGRPNGTSTTGITVSGQVIESINCYDLASNTVTLSFYAKCGANFSASGSNLGVTLYTGTGVDQGASSMTTASWTGSATPISTTATLTTSWQRFTFTASTLGASVSEVGLYLSWVPVGTAGSDDNVYITGVQLEKGSTATSFDYRPYGTELALCQRYCFRYDGMVGVAKDSYNLYQPVLRMPVTMRSTPSLASGATMTVSGGPTGTWATYSDSGAQATANNVYLYNVSGSWSGNPNTSIGNAIFTAEL